VPQASVDPRVLRVIQELKELVGSQVIQVQQVLREHKDLQEHKVIQEVL
jgi:hypothetical protein